ncbi:MAG TPA: methyltransferase [Pseudonocardiaceae bacterium]|jgi:hypothetical protein
MWSPERRGENQVTPDPIIALGTAFCGAKTLLSAVELGVFSELAEAGPLSGEELRARLKLHPRGARDFFDAMVALDLLVRDNGNYSNTPASELFLDKSKLSYAGGLLEMANAQMYRTWGSLTAGLRTGRAQHEVKSGEDLFQEFYTDPVRTSQFVRAMTAISADAARAIATKFPWHDHSSVIDIGCAEGALPVRIAMAHEHITGGGLDLPTLGPLFTGYVERFGLGERLSFIAGDFFVDALPQADVLVMGHILHGADIDQKRLLLRKAYESLPRGGALIVYDTIIDDERRHNVYGLLMSLHMLLDSPGGFEYTGMDCRAWMREAGFRKSYVEHLAGPRSMVVGIK